MIYPSLVKTRKIMFSVITFSQIIWSIILMRIAWLLSAYALPICVFLVQNTHIHNSYSSELPWLFYLFVSVGMLGLSLVSSAFVTKRVQVNPDPNPTIGILPFCSECNMFIYPRAYHCPKCNCCVQRHVVHSELTGACIGQVDILFVFSGCVISIFYFTGTVIEAVSSFHISLGALGHFLLPIVIFVAVLCCIQSMITTAALFRVITTNGIVLEVRRVWIFEVWEVQNPHRNPYCLTTSENVTEAAIPSHPMCWDGLCESELTSSYCEDWLKYRNIDLSPTIMSREERNSK